MEHLGAFGEIAEKLCHASPALLCDLWVGFVSIACSWENFLVTCPGEVNSLKCLNQVTQTLK